VTTSRELIRALLRGDRVARVGLMDSPWSDALLLWVRDGYPTRMEHHAPGELRWRPDDGGWEEATEDGDYLEPVPPWEHFSYDLTNAGPWFDAMPIRDFSEIEAETDEWEVRRNGAGAALKYWKHKMGTPEHMDFRMTTRAVWEQDYRPYVLALDPQRVDVTQLRKSAAKAREADVWLGYGHLFIWELMRQSMGDVTLYESLILDPGWLHDYNRVYTEFFKAHFAYMFEQVGLPDGVWIYEDLGYKNGLFASPKMLSNAIFPYYAELVDFFHGHGLPVILHTCGSTAAALPMIVDAGFDALNPMERKAKDNDPFLFAERYGDKLAFVGGLDTRVFETNDRDIIRREVAAYIDGMKARNARLVFASDHSISPNTTYDSYRYALDVYREHMWY
jgi:uroporphyrinogen decarboxylase